MKKFLILLLMPWLVTGCFLLDDLWMSDEININLPSKEIFFSAESGESTLAFTTSADWNASIMSYSTDSQWCSIAPSNGGKGDSEILISVSQNDLESERSLYLLLEAGSARDSIKVIQRSYLRYALYKKEVDGFDMIVTPTNAYAVIVESPDKDYLVLLTGDLKDAESAYMLLDANGYVRAMTLSDGSLAMFVYMPDEVWIAGADGNIIKKIAYSDFSRIETEKNQTIKNPIYDAIKIKDFIHKSINGERCEMTDMILQCFSDGKIQSSSQAADILVNSICDIEQVRSICGLYESRIESMFFNNTTIGLQSCEIYDFIKVKLKYEVINIPQETLYAKAREIYGESVKCSYVLKLNLYDIDNLSSPIIHEDSESISSDSVISFDCILDKLNHDYMYQCDLTINADIEVDYNQSVNATVKYISSSYDISNVASNIDAYSYTLNGIADTLRTSSVHSKIISVSNITDVSADLLCNFSDVPDGAICGVEYYCLNGNVCNQIVDVLSDECVISLKELQSETEYICKSYIRFSDTNYYSSDQFIFTTAADSGVATFPDLSGTWYCVVDGSPYGYIDFKISAKSDDRVEYLGTKGNNYHTIVVYHDLTCEYRVKSGISMNQNTYRNGKMNEMFTYACGDELIDWMGRISNTPWYVQKQE